MAAILFPSSSCFLPWFLSPFSGYLSSPGNFSVNFPMSFIHLSSCQPPFLLPSPLLPLLHLPLYPWRGDGLHHDFFYRLKGYVALRGSTSLTSVRQLWPWKATVVVLETASGREKIHSTLLCGRQVIPFRFFPFPSLPFFPFPFSFAFC
jgi:hypothetical protein